MTNSWETSEAHPTDQRDSGGDGEPSDERDTDHRDGFDDSRDRDLRVRLLVVGSAVRSVLNGISKHDSVHPPGKNLKKVRGVHVHGPPTK